MQLFKYVKAKQFFPKFAPGVKCYHHKQRGTDGKRPFSFSEADKKAIREGLKAMLKENATMLQK